jgi:hypothetical protein
MVEHQGIGGGLLKGFNVLKSLVVAEIGSIENMQWRELHYPPGYDSTCAL